MRSEKHSKCFQSIPKNRKKKTSFISSPAQRRPQRQKQNWETKQKRHASLIHSHRCLGATATVTTTTTSRHRRRQPVKSKLHATFVSIYRPAHFFFFFVSVSSVHARRSAFCGILLIEIQWLKVFYTWCFCTLWALSFCACVRMCVWVGGCCRYLPVCTRLTSQHCQRSAYQNSIAWKPKSKLFYICGAVTLREIAWKI